MNLYSWLIFYWCLYSFEKFQAKDQRFKFLQPEKELTEKLCDLH